MVQVSVTPGRPVTIRTGLEMCTAWQLRVHELARLTLEDAWFD
jgi:hypothetical protein